MQIIQEVDSQMNPLDRPTQYTIVVAGRLDERWADWLSDMSLQETTDVDGAAATMLEGRLPDQAALRGLLTRIWDLGLVIRAVYSSQREPGPDGLPNMVEPAGADPGGCPLPGIGCSSGSRPGRSRAPRGRIPGKAAATASG